MSADLKTFTVADTTGQRLREATTLLNRERQHDLAVLRTCSELGMNVRLSGSRFFRDDLPVSRAELEADMRARWQSE